MANNTDYNEKEQYIASLDKENQELYSAIVQIIKSKQIKTKLSPQDYIKISVSEFVKFLKEEKEIFVSDSKIQKFIKNLEEQEIISVQHKGGGNCRNEYRIIYDKSTLPDLPILPALKGWIALSDSRYIRRRGDEICEKLLDKHNGNLEQGIFIKIHGARQTGKTSLLKRIENYLLQQSCYVVPLDFKNDKFRQSFDELDKFTNVFLESIHKQFENLLKPSKFDISNLDGFEIEYKLKSYLQDKIFEYLREQPIILLIDNFQEIFATKSQIFLEILRVWFDDYIKTYQWKRFSIIFTYSVEDYGDWGNRNSPFANIDCEKIELQEFSGEDILDLAAKYGMDWKEGIEKATRLKEFLGGHPYLVNQALHSIAHDNMNIDTLKEQANSLESPFYYHLNDYENILNKNKNKKLRELYLRILNEETIENNQSNRLLQIPLLKMGLIKLDSSPKPKVRCELYKKYFKDITWEDNNDN
jgi:AAA-like domain